MPDIDTLIQKVTEEVRKRLTGEGSGHDWWHIHRVLQLGKRIARAEEADEEVVELALLLHDIADHKFHGGDHSVGPRVAGEILNQFGADEAVTRQVCDIISRISFSGKNTTPEPDNLELMVCQDADRLDAIGAIGIARAFAMGAKFDEVFHDPDVPVPEHATAASYSEVKGKGGRTVINHFHEKLLLLKDMMNTETAKMLAQHRHDFMVAYLGEFHDEWAGNW